MRKIIIGRESVGLFDGDLDSKDFVFFSKHKDVFKNMWHDQGKRFWKRFLLAFQTSCAEQIPEEVKDVDTLFQCGYSYIDAQYVEGRFSNARRFLEDIFIFAKSKSTGAISSAPVAWDHFYVKDTRQTYRTLFGPPGVHSTMLKVYFIAPLYIHFGKAVCNCVRYWINAEKCDSADESYWTSEFVRKYGMDTDLIQFSDLQLHTCKKNKKSKSKSSQEKEKGSAPMEDLHRDMPKTQTKKEDRTQPRVNSSENKSKTLQSENNLEDPWKVTDPFKTSNFDALLEGDLKCEAKRRNVTTEEIHATECRCQNTSMFCRCSQNSAMQSCVKDEVAQLRRYIMRTRLSYKPSTSSESKPSSAKSDASTKTSEASVVGEYVNKNANHRICDFCKVVEPKPKLFMKCQRCYREKLAEPKYYCGRECQVAAWKSHRMDHIPAEAASH